MEAVSTDDWRRLLWGLLRISNRDCSAQHVVYMKADDYFACVMSVFREFPPTDDRKGEALQEARDRLFVVANTGITVYSSELDSEVGSSCVERLEWIMGRYREEKFRGIRNRQPQDELRRYRDMLFVLSAASADHYNGLQPDDILTGEQFDAERSEALVYNFDAMRALLMYPPKKEEQLVNVMRLCRVGLEQYSGELREAMSPAVLDRISHELRKRT